MFSIPSWLLLSCLGAGGRGGKGGGASCSCRGNGGAFSSGGNGGGGVFGVGGGKGDWNVFGCLVFAGSWGLRIVFVRREIPESMLEGVQLVRPGEKIIGVDEGSESDEGVHEDSVRLEKG